MAKRTTKQIELMCVCKVPSPLFGSGEYANARRLEKAGVVRQIVKAGNVLYELTDAGRAELAAIESAERSERDAGK